MPLFNPEKYNIIPSKKAFLWRAGYYKEDQLPVSVISQLANEIPELGLTIAHPSVEYLLLNIQEIDPELIPKSFHDSDMVLVFTSTLGFPFDEKLNELLNLNMKLKAVLLDAWGSEALETLNNYFEKHFLFEHKMNQNTKRFSPGYKGLDIRINHRLLDVLGAATVHSDRETGILSPRKSSICLLGLKKNRD